MKKFTLTKSNAYDLASVMSTVIREQSEKLDFKEVISIQKSVNLLLSETEDFSEKLAVVTKDRTELVEIAN